jgi:hypothetical protein
MGRWLLCTNGDLAFLSLEKDLGVPARSLVGGFDAELPERCRDDISLIKEEGRARTCSP